MAATQSRGAETLAAAKKAEVKDAKEPGEIFALGHNATIGFRRSTSPVVTGGLMQSNPLLAKPDRRQLGLALRF